MAFTSISKDLVYYNLLKDDAITYNKPYLTSLYSDAFNNIKEVSFDKQLSAGSRLIMMAKAEATKEQMLLSQVFGNELNLSFDSKDDVKKLTEAVNAAFHFKTVYERNKAMLTSPKFRSGIKAVFSWFPTYFIRFFSKQSKTIINNVNAAMAANTSLTLKQATKQVMDKLIPEVEFKAVKAMLTEARTEIGVDDKFQQAYIEIFQAIEQDFNAGRSNPFLDGLRKTYGLDKIAVEMRKKVSNRKKFFSGSVSGGIKDIDVQMRKGGYGGNTVYQGGGIAFENLIDQAISMAMNSIGSGGNNTVKWHTETISNIGSYNARPDNILLITENPTLLLRQLEADLQKNQIGRGREEDVEAFSRLGNNLSKLNSGFIVYFNDKNINIGDKKRSHTAGSMTLAQMQSLLSGIINNMSQLVYNILQDTKGAVGNGPSDNTRNTIAQAVAYFLYDDYNTIGSISTGGQSIHIMALEGVLIPLSAYLFAMGNAMMEVMHVSSYSDVSISTPSILFGKGVKDARGGGARFYSDNWNEQQKDSLNNTKIKVTFLKNLVDFVKGYLV